MMSSRRLVLSPIVYVVVSGSVEITKQHMLHFDYHFVMVTLEMHDIIFNVQVGIQITKLFKLSFLFTILTVTIIKEVLATSLMPWAYPLKSS